VAVTIERGGAELITQLQPLGRALLDAVFGQLRALGVRHWAVGVVASNADAIRFYERLDLLPFVNSSIGEVP
jgi:ribosomal protein S18 acetylase RimI-like enzyme